MNNVNEYVKESVGMLSVRFKIVLAIALALSLALEYVVHRHSYFEIDGLPFFYAVFGFCTCGVIIVVSKLLGFVVKQNDSYYQKDDE